MARPRLRSLGLLVLGACLIVFVGRYVLLGRESFRVFDTYDTEVRLHLEHEDSVRHSSSETASLITTERVSYRPLHTSKQSSNGSLRRREDELRRHTDTLPSDSLPSTEADREYVDSTAPTVLVADKDNELDVVSSRLSACLDATNLTWHFKNEGYYDRAHADAERLFRNLRRAVPTFSEPYTIPCWKTSFYATWTSQQTKIVTGNIGDVDFSYTIPRELVQFGHPRLLSSAASGKHTSLRQSVACLPKVFLLGYPKCGSTFLYCVLRRVLKVALGIEGLCEVEKEPHWWIVQGALKRLHPKDVDYLSLYLINFHPGARYREKDMPAVTIDASPNLMFQWPRYYEEETMENYCLLPSLIPVILPDSKYFVVMRNPVTMLYSTFWFSCTMLDKKLGEVKYHGPDIFHNRITNKIAIFNDCKRQGKPLDLCVDLVAPNMFTPELPVCGRARLEMGLYYFHARKWLSVVPRERMHFFTMEELATEDMQHTAKVILDFLELPAAKIGSSLNCNENTQYKIDYKHDSRLRMREDTKQILEEFFQPYNQMLADLLGDDKFLWK